MEHSRFEVLALKTISPLGAIGAVPWVGWSGAELCTQRFLCFPEEFCCCPDRQLRIIHGKMRIWGCREWGLSLTLCRCLAAPSTAQYGITGHAEVLFSCWSLVFALSSLSSIFYLKNILLH